jgi:3'-phosphoadenosine 5'-phosphosulfate sulfotransferase (PAPS reductase)/FAD synthetase
MLHLIENVRKQFNLPPVKYVFFNTGFEMQATHRHVEEVQELYNVEIETVRPKKSIITSCREHGIPFITKHISQAVETIQRKNIPLSIYYEFKNSDDKIVKRKQLSETYPKSEQSLKFLCECFKTGEAITNSQLIISGQKYLIDFLIENPIQFSISNKCCKYCKKQPANKAQKDFDLIITGERKSEGGTRSFSKNKEQNSNGCFARLADKKYKFRPLYFVSDKDKEWYKEYYGIRYSDAYEVYGLKRTGCCGCPISAKAVDDLEKIRQYEPILVNAAYRVFGESYKFRQRYNEYKKQRDKEAKEAEEAEKNKDQLSFESLEKVS